MKNRSERIVLKVTPDMMDRINQVAERMQINPTSLCATWISEKVDELECKAKLHDDGVSRVIEGIFQSIDNADAKQGIYRLRKMFDDIDRK